MSYNVRMFNLYKWIDEEGVDKKIYDFIKAKDPAILCIQEFHETKNIGFKKEGRNQDISWSFLLYGLLGNL